MSICDLGVEVGPELAVHDPLIDQAPRPLWACYFFTTRVLSRRGWKWASVLAFIHLGSRKVIVTQATLRPDHGWTGEVAECLAGEVAKLGLPRPTIVLRDNDATFWEGFDEGLAAQGIRAERLPVQAPLCNAHMERWIQSLRRECLDHFISVGLKHLDHLVSEYLEHYHLERPHQGLGNRLLGDRPPGQGPPRDEGEVVCRPRLGGVLRHYERRSAA